MEGYLFKLVNFFEGWKPRYAIIKGYRMEMGLKKEDTAKKIYNLITLKVVPKDKCEFTLDLGAKKLQLKAYTEVERNAWVNSIKDKQLQYTLESQQGNIKDENNWEMISERGSISVNNLQNKRLSRESVGGLVKDSSLQDSLYFLQKYILSMNGTLNSFHEYIYNKQIQDPEILKIYEQLILLKSNLRNTMEDLISSIPSEILEKSDFEINGSSSQERYEKEINLKKRESNVSMLSSNTNEISLFRNLQEDTDNLSPLKSKTQIYTSIKLSRLNSSTIMDQELLSKIYKYATEQSFLLDSKKYEVRASIKTELKYPDDFSNKLVSVATSEKEVYQYREPLTNLQKEAESLQFYYLLDLAHQQKTNWLKMAYVCAFIVAEASLNINRILKPVEADLGETYQVVDDIQSFRFFAEQVSISPSTSALTVESERIFIFGSSNFSQTFSLLKGQIEHKFNCNKNLLFLDRKQGRVDNHYLLKKPNFLVKNLIFGRPTTDLIGSLEIKDFLNQDVTALLDFNEGNNRRNSSVEGTIMGPNGKIEYIIRGTWKEEINLYDASGINLIHNLWKMSSSQQINNMTNEGAYSLSSYGCNLNNLPIEMNTEILPTDSRFNQKARALENNDIEKYKELTIDVAKLKSKGDLYSPNYFESVNIIDTSIYFPKRDYYRQKYINS